MEETTQPMQIRSTPLEKQKVTLGVVCLLLGCVSGMSMKVGITSKTIDNLSDQIAGVRAAIEKRDNDWKLEQRAIYEHFDQLEIKVGVQAQQINDLKMDIDRLDSNRRR